VKVDCAKLTTCGVTASGDTIELNLVDAAGARVCVRLPFDQAEAVAMTLPHLLTRALKRRTGKPEARYVFDLGEWLIEGAKGQNCLIVTLKTTDGFEVSFGIPFAEGQSLGWTLKREADAAADAQGLIADRLAGGGFGQH